MRHNNQPLILRTACLSLTTLAQIRIQFRQRVHLVLLILEKLLGVLDEEGWLQVEDFFAISSLIRKSREGWRLCLAVRHLLLYFVDVVFGGGLPLEVGTALSRHLLRRLKLQLIRERHEVTAVLQNVSRIPNHHIELVVLFQREGPVVQHLRVAAFVQHVLVG